MTEPSPPPQRRRTTPGRVPPDRRLRPARRLHDGRARRDVGFDRLAVPAALRQPRGLRPDPRSRGRHWSIAPTGEAAVTAVVSRVARRRDDVHDRHGHRAADDALAFAPGQRGHDLGKDAPHEVLRLVEGVIGEVELRCELAPQPECGLVRPLLRMEGDGGRTFGGPNRIAVRAGVPVEVHDATMTARSASRRARRSAQPALGGADDPAPRRRARRRRRTGRRRRRGLALVGGRARHLRGPNRELVRFGARVLKGLTYRPTGAIVAAPTAGLPETEAASATGTTAARGYATRASPCRRSTSGRAPTRRRRSCRS